MKKTFVCDESMIITIPIGSLRNTTEGHLMPEKFNCVYRDSYKVFALKGKPKSLGAAQAVAGVFILTLGLIFGRTDAGVRFDIWIFTLPSTVFVVSGMLSYAAGRFPNIHVTKLSFSLNIISIFWSFVAVLFSAMWLYDVQMQSSKNIQLCRGINGLIMTLLIVEKLLAIVLTYWLSKAVCREHFNTLPIILLKHAE
ncbi:uncharacterized protein LOC117266381 [Xyrichtys novacula]|uniref:Uncharacterized protein LOC117266381 n=1 Tax=Xyrichtys novacula TaxID=13765 RepID=A0AAV1FLZ1_XYRNO|nr:uncharacterized protein LOC117266381 [Xyrichtys novacula]